MFLFNIEALVTDIYLTDESNHFIEDTAAFWDVHISINLFFTDDGTGMDAKVI